MPFRADESADVNYDKALRYLTRSLPNSLRQKAKEHLDDLVDDLGPVVDRYPSWHPIVANQKAPHAPQTTPSKLCGYNGIDHTILFRDGFLACPYGTKNKDLIDSVKKLPSHPLYLLVAQELKAQLYHEEAKPVIVKCHWMMATPADRTVPMRLAIGCLLEQELPAWQKSDHAETWDTMRAYFLGEPCGSRSSLFVNERTGQGLKRLWNTLIQSGVFGPINVGGL